MYIMWFAESGLPFELTCFERATKMSPILQESMLQAANVDTQPVEEKRVKVQESISIQIFKGCSDTLVAILVYVIIIHIAKYYNAAHVIHYDRLFTFTIIFSFISVVLRMIKKPLGNLFVNSLFFSLGGLFIRDVLGQG